MSENNELEVKFLDVTKEIVEDTDQAYTDESLTEEIRDEYTKLNVPLTDESKRCI